jgi:hypothetical protein
MKEYKLLESYISEIDGMIDQQSPPPAPAVQPTPFNKRIKGFKTKLMHTKIRMSHANRLAKLRAKLAKAKTSEQRQKIQSSINLLQTWYSNKIRQLS